MRGFVGAFWFLVFVLFVLLTGAYSGSTLDAGISLLATMRLSLSPVSCTSRRIKMFLNFKYLMQKRLPR